ncbi:MAG: ATP-binding protein [Syntrophomonadaceae bacterium]|nr:ATP-binding protein [Syntrophomonadaceae bacterium]
MTYHYKKALAEFNLEEMNTGIEIFCEQNKVAANKLFAIQLIIEELVSNIIKYGSSARADEIISIELVSAADLITLTIQDNSNAFNPLKSNEPDIALSAEERDPGGLGLFLVRKKVRSLSYEYKDGVNTVKAEI